MAMGRNLTVEYGQDVLINHVHRVKKITVEISEALRGAET